MEAERDENRCGFDDEARDPPPPPGTERLSFKIHHGLSWLLGESFPHWYTVQAYIHFHACTPFQLPTYISICSLILTCCSVLSFQPSPLSPSQSVSLSPSSFDTRNKNDGFLAVRPLDA